ncbi:MAG: hypothetical protein LBB84_02530 [Tannerellaceae bacterium]|jgi:hypothetical protein|nr:hypothetical protein [Tannerellaceae bacterium]
MAKRLGITLTKVIVLTALLIPFSAVAQERAKFEVSAGADLVSSYVWRGVYQTGVAIQPGVTLSLGNFSLGAWGSTDFSTMAKEFDISLGYEAGGFSIGLTDYWWAGEGNPYGHYNEFHFLEGTVGFSFGESFPLSLSWSTMFGYDGDKNGEDKQQYSTFLGAGYDFNVKGVALTAGIGISPWTGIYHKAGTEGFALSTLSLKAVKAIKITDAYALPVFVETIIAPNQDNVFLVFGVTL